MKKIKISIRKRDELIRIVNGFLIDLPSPSRLRYMWNFGSLLGIYLIFQILTGLILAIQFTGDMNLSFYRVVHMMRDVNFGWLVRGLHANGASLFFFLIYFHIGRGLYYGSYENIKTWMSGVTILLFRMATGFLGYVLPWGQISFWAATVITNLLSVIPYVGKLIVEWVWGGFAVRNPTLIRFFSFHFVLPFIILALVILHLIFLHVKGSGNIVGVRRSIDKIIFNPYYVIKDIYGLMLVVIVMLWICLENPYMFMDVENFIESNPLVTPVHIQPEWYFLFAYTILRSISRKIGGVVALVISIIILYFLPFCFKSRIKGISSNIWMKMIFWYLVANWLLLTWIGSCEVINPYDIIGCHFRFLYFLLYLILWIFNYYYNKIWLYKNETFWKRF